MNGIKKWCVKRVETDIYEFLLLYPEAPKEINLALEIERQTL